MLPLNFTFPSTATHGLAAFTLPGVALVAGGVYLVAGGVYLIIGE